MALALVAGFVDAYGYLRWGAFGANMTGNTVILAISLFRSASQALLSLTLVMLFLVGAIFGHEIMERFRSHAALYAEAALIAVASFAHGYAVLPIVSLAMGMQNTALSTFAGVAANTSFLSGDYTQLGRAIAGAVLRRGTDRESNTISIIWPLVATYAFGALLGSFLNRVPLSLLLVVPVIAVLAVAMQRRVLKPS